MSLLHCRNLNNPPKGVYKIPNNEAGKQIDKQVNATCDNKI